MPNLEDLYSARNSAIDNADQAHKTWAELMFAILTKQAEELIKAANYPDPVSFYSEVSDMEDPFLAKLYICTKDPNTLRNKVLYDFWRESNKTRGIYIIVSNEL